MSRFNLKSSIEKASQEVNRTNPPTNTTDKQPEILAMDIPENFDTFLKRLVDKISGIFLQNLCSNLKIEFLTIETDATLREKIETAYNTGSSKRKREIKSLLISAGMEGMR